MADGPQTGRMYASRSARHPSVAAASWVVAATLALASCGGGGGGGDDAPSGPFGLDVRPINTTCVAPDLGTGNTTITTVDAFPAAPRFQQPTKILQAPGDGSRWFVLEKGGRIRVFSTANPAVVGTWLDFSTQVNDNGEGGLLGMAFHPDYPATREVFVSYTIGAPMISRVSRLILDNVTTPGAVIEEVLLTVNQPPFENHKGGDIAFGPDGNLYFGLGDGGSANDPSGYAQNDTRLLGKMLRIDVVDVPWPTPGYLIPSGNPHETNPVCGPGANGASCPEIYASGFRNPWRWSFDEPTGELWVGDVGQGSREEVNKVERGANYGWNCREGSIEGPGDCGPAGMEDPVSEYGHSDGNDSITGGYVYRGDSLPALRGRYVFGDFGSGRIWALDDDGQGGYTNEELVDTAYLITAFGLDADGELYFADYGNGRIRRLAGTGGGSGDPVPDDLADTGCMDPANPTAPASGLIPYTVNADFWSDGATKERYMALPDGRQVANRANGDFDFPAGSVLVKSFRLGGQLIETRLLMRHPDAGWAGYTYEWNDAQTVATRVRGGKTRQVGGQAWIYPSEGECLQCHTSVAGFTLGPEIAQLNGLLTYPDSDVTANQLATLDHINVLSPGLAAPPDALPALADPEDSAAPLADRARAWLHTNCAQCHRPGGPTPSSLDLRAATALAAMNACGVEPQSGDLGIADARLIAPGDAARSVLVARTNRRDANGMPPVGSSEVDAGGVALLADWINSLAGCQ